MPGLLDGLYALGNQPERPQGLLGGGLAPYGFRHEESVFAPATVKGRGFLGALPHASGGQATEISAHNEANRGFPLIVPGLNRMELALLLRGDEPTEEIYRKAAQYAAMREAGGRSPFAQPTELRVPPWFLSNTLKETR